MRRDQKKHQKEKKREKKNTERKRHAEHVARERSRREQYPKVLFDSAKGDPEFVEAVRAALHSIDFDDRTIFSDMERAFYKLLRERGANEAVPGATRLLRSSSLPENEKEIRILSLHLGFGTRLLERIPEDLRRRMMPYNDVQVHFVGQNIVLRFFSLLKAKGSGGTVYFSWRKPTVEFDGHKYTIAFSRHAIERICERINPRYIEYAAAGDIYALFADCVYVEPVVLHGDQPAFILYGECGHPPFHSYSVYVEKILGKANVDPSKGNCYYRVGYCPVAFDGEFAKATTMLFPGYSGTPEHRLILTAKLSREERERLLAEAKSLDANEVMLNLSHRTIKWFHDNGVPQVVQMTRPVYVAPGSK